MKRYGEAVRQGVRYRYRPGVYAILAKGNNVLLTHQSQPVSELQLPGGGIGPEESTIGALHREVFEETGWQIAFPRRIGAYRRFTYIPEYGLWAEKICHIYSALPVLRKGLPPEDDHLAVWMSIREAVKELDSDGDRAFLGRYWHSQCLTRRSDRNGIGT